MSRSGLTGIIVGSSIVLSAGQSLAQVSCGSTITNNTTLSRDLNNCQGKGIVIGAANITLDLGGHTIDGVGMDNGVDNTQGYNGVTIMNGRIREFGTGVRLDNATQNRLSRLVVSYNQDGIFLSDSNNNRIERNTTSDNDNTGINITSAMGGNGSDNNLVDRNMSFDNRNFGIAVENKSDGNRIRRNEANNNGFFNGNSGIFIDDSTIGTTIEDNVANRNKMDGISIGNVVTTTVATTVRGNTANNNGQWGVNVVASNTDRGGNRARGNGNPTGECKNVVCP